MIKDLVVNLRRERPRCRRPLRDLDRRSVRARMSPASRSATSRSSRRRIMGGIPASLIEAQRAENDKAANDASRKIRRGCRTRAGVSFDSRILTASLAGSADRFGAIARRFDLAVVGQAEPGEGAPEELIVEGALFSSGRPVVVVPYIQKAGAQARSRDGVLGREPQRRTRDRRRDAAARARQGDRRGDRRERAGRRATRFPAPTSASISRATASRSRSSASSRPTPTWRARSCRTRPTRPPTSS